MLRVRLDLRVVPEGESPQWRLRDIEDICVYMGILFIESATEQEERSEENEILPELILLTLGGGKAKLD
eukprot:scaffold24680_cov113-Cylindrotheca_fusiformis.AAC.2